MTEKLFFVICPQSAGDCRVGRTGIQFLWEFGTAWKIFIISLKCWQHDVRIPQQHGNNLVREMVFFLSSPTCKLFIRICLRSEEMPEMFWLLLHWVNCSVNKFLYFWLLWDVRGRQIRRRSQSHRSHDDHFCHRQWLVKRGEKHALLLWISRLNDPTYWVIIARMTQFIVGLVSVQPRLWV